MTFERFLEDRVARDKLKNAENLLQFVLVDVEFIIFTEQEVKIEVIRGNTSVIE